MLTIKYSMDKKFVLITVNPYVAEYIDDIRETFKERKYLKETKTWKIPAKYGSDIRSFAIRNDVELSESMKDDLVKNTNLYSITLNKRIYEISFPVYEKELIESIKNIPGRIWDKENKIWTIPDYSLKYLKKIVQEFSNKTGKNFFWETKESNVAEICAKIERTPKINRYLLNYKFPEYHSKPGKPYNHQIEGVREALIKEKYGIFDDPGLGKTYQGICCIDILQKYKNAKKVLIICKSSLKYNWYNELVDLFPDWKEDIVIYDKPSKKEENEFEGHITRDLKKINKYKILIINYDNIFSYRNILMDWLKENIKENILILDESQKVKNPKTKVTRTVIGFKSQGKEGENFPGLMRKCHYRFILTGTPIADKPIDAWSQMKIVEGNVSNSYNAFLNMFCNFGPWGPITGDYKNMTLLRDIISEVSIRRMKEDCPDIPEKIYQNYYCSFTKKQAEYYKRIQKEIGLELFKNGELIKIDPVNILAKIVRLNQIASNPALLDDNFDPEDSCKYQELEELLEEFIEEQGKKVIVWTNFTENVNFMLKKFDKYKPCYITGGMSSYERQKQVDNFQKNPENRIFISSPAGAEGITLTASSISIYIDSSFKLDFWRQSEDRSNRYGQKEKCLVIYLLAKNTVDEYIYNTVLSKRGISDYLQGDKDEIIVPKISVKELKKLLDI